MEPKYVLLDPDECALKSGTMEEINEYWEMFGESHGGEDYLSDCTLYPLGDSLVFSFEDGKIVID
jgi:hypothetical protein